MFSFILEFKWIILFVFEFFAWAATFFMFYARYKMRSQVWFRVASIALILTGVIPQVLLGVVNFIATREVDLFTIAIVLLIVYGLTIGKKQVAAVDNWAQKRFSKTPEDL
ncbi:hypothetical protein [Sporomusa sp.]|uniref:hypothetical protein n=1 Tax=Sporomusa sp. TaxID=2078658 RepID=UPI002CA1DC23|nr:hypothetical protein [Sporomusa sp.]HWR42720.1 hypothetical protein [Sporomusa sp.]